MKKHKGRWYEHAAAYLHEDGVTDVISGESYISHGEARRILGNRLRVNPLLQNCVIDELIDAGFVDRVNQRTLRIKKVKEGAALVVRRRRVRIRTAQKK